MKILQRLINAKNDREHSITEYHEAFAELEAELETLGLRLEPIDNVPVDSVDMSDWRNWKPGDLVQCISSENDGSGRLFDVKVGEIYPITNITGSGVMVTRGGSLGRNKAYKFHSRPKVQS